MLANLIIKNKQTNKDKVYEIVLNIKLFYNTIKLILDKYPNLSSEKLKLPIDELINLFRKIKTGVGYDLFKCEVIILYFCIMDTEFVNVFCLNNELEYKKIIKIFTTFHESSDSVEFPIFNGGLFAEDKAKYLNKMKVC